MRGRGGQSQVTSPGRNHPLYPWSRRAQTASGSCCITRQGSFSFPSGPLRAPQSYSHHLMTGLGNIVPLEKAWRAFQNPTRITPAESLFSALPDTGGLWSLGPHVGPHLIPGGALSTGLPDTLVLDFLPGKGKPLPIRCRSLGPVLSRPAPRTPGETGMSGPGAGGPGEAHHLSSPNPR